MNARLYRAALFISLGGTILLIAALLASSAQGRDLTPSIGLTYSMLDLGAANDQPSYALYGFHETSYAVDLRWPLAEWFDLTLAGGKTWLQTDSWTPTFKLQSVTVDSSGNPIGTYGVAGANRQRSSLDGYNVSASARFYFK